MSVDAPDGAPSPDALQSVFYVYEVSQDDDELRYVGDPVASRERLVEVAWPLFREQGYDVSLAREDHEYVLVAQPTATDDGAIPWTNLVLFLATVASTIWAGALWYYADLGSDPWSVLEGWPFAVGVLAVLGTHEFGHYALSRYHDVDASLPYFIPMPTIIGTMGAIIKMKGQIPDRRALFDIGVAGPLAGLVATVVVTAVGLTLPPVTVPQRVLEATNAIGIQFGWPPLLEMIAWVLGEPLAYEDPTKVLNPVVIAGWVGMFVTFLNLLPVGQLDGGHILRAILGPRQRTVGALVPALLLGLAGALFFFDGLLAGFPYYVEDASGVSSIWAFWGVLTLIVAYMGPARPVSEADLGLRRQLVGALTLLLGALCFTPVPIRIVV